MSASWFLTSKSFLLSIILHAVIGIVLIFSFEFNPAPSPQPKPKVNIVDAVSVDKKQVEQELKRLKEKEDAQKAADLKRQKELDALKKQRQQEEEKLKKIKKQKAEAEKKRKAEQARIKKLEAEKKRKAEAEKKAREEALQAELDAELAAEQEQQDLNEIQKYTLLIANAVENNFNKFGLPEGLSCVILIRLLEGGKVADVSIATSSGNDLFDKRAESAVYAASPLPTPEELRLFEKMRNIRFIFEP